MVNFVLVATVCLGALLGLHTAAGCGGRRCGGHGGHHFSFGGGCGGRRPCHHGFGGSPPCGHHGGRPCGGHSGGPFGGHFGGHVGGGSSGGRGGGHHFGGHFGGHVGGGSSGGRWGHHFGGRSSGGRSSGGRSSGGASFHGRPPCGHPPCGLLGMFGHHGGSRPQHGICPLGNLIHKAGGFLKGWLSGGRFNPHGQNCGEIGIQLPHYTIAHKQPPISGSRGPFSWITTYIRNVRYLVFTYKFLVDGTWEEKSHNYPYPEGDKRPILELLALFKTFINWKPAPPVVQHESIHGNLGRFSWKTTWTNGKGKITFYYRIIRNGKFVIKETKTFAINNQDEATIDKYLLKFQESFHWTAENKLPSTDGEHFDYKADFSDGQGSITFYYKYYIDGQLIVSVSKEYSFNPSGNINDQIESFYSQFKIYCEQKRKDSNAQTEQKKESGKITWKTENVNGVTYFKATYNHYEDGVLTDTLSKDYKMAENTEKETDKWLEQFKEDLRNGNV